MNNTFKKIVAICIVIAFAGCKTPSVIQRNENKEVPDSFVSSETIKDTINSGKIKWKDYFNDPKLEDDIGMQEAVRIASDYSLLTKQMPLDLAEIKDLKKKSKATKKIANAKKETDKPAEKKPLLNQVK